MSTVSAASTPTHIAGFEVLAKIGEGGMGAVYKARDPDLDRFVAIKLLRHGFDNPEFRERLKLEARSAATLDSPHIVTVHSFGVHEGAPFLVMEFVPGTTLERLIKSRHQLSIAQKLRLMEALCEGLGVAHRRRVIHRDIKPSNLILSDDGVLKILDFGIAKAISRAALTPQTRAFMGTPNYMSPEQVLNAQTVDTRSDIFAVGAVFYELLTYELAFPGEQFVAVDAVLHREPEPLERFCPTLDPQIARVVSRALAKDVQHRYQTLAELGRDIVAIRERLSDAETIVSPGSMRPAPSQDSENVTTVPLADIAATLKEALGASDPLDRHLPRRHRVAIWTAVALALIIVAASGVWLYPEWHRPDQKNSTTAAAGPPPAPSPGDGNKQGEQLPTPPSPNSRQLSDLHRATLDALDHNEFNAAFRAVSEANTISPGDSDVHSDTDRTLQLLRGDVDRRRREYPADSIDIHVRKASALRSSANRSLSYGREIEAIQLLITARDELMKARPVGPVSQPRNAGNGSAEPRQAASQSKSVDEATSTSSSPPDQAGPTPPTTQPQKDAVSPKTTETQLAPPKPQVPQPTDTLPPVTPKRPEDSELIQSVLDQYVSAYRGLNALALQRIWPSIPGRVRDDFAKFSSYKLTLVDQNIRVDGDVARVTCTRQISAQPTAGQRQNRSQPTLIELRRHGASWEITDVR